MRLVKTGQKGMLVALFCSIIFCAFVQATTANNIPGDVDGNGIVNAKDAELVVRHVKDQRIQLPHPENADANEDGRITIEDASAISQRIEGISRVVVASAEYGLHGRTHVGSLIRIEVFERFFPLHVTGGTVRIKSPSTGYDLGEQRLVFERHGRSLYYHWNTGGLRPASDYQVYVRLTESAASRGVLGVPSWPNPDKLARHDILVKLIPQSYEVTQLAQAQDAFAPCPGISLVFRRVSPHDSVYAPRLGPMGFGWMHDFDIHLTEFTNGRIAFVGPNGFNRWFESNHDGTYKASPGDNGVLSRDPDGTFQLKEKDGFIYRFRSDLLLDCIQDTNNNRVSAIYDASNQLIRLHHSCGKSFSLEYNTAGRIVALTDHVGRITRYEYDSSNQMLTKVVDPAGAVTEYTYILGQSDVLDHRLIAIAFPDGTCTHYDYDSQARLIRKTGPHGANPIHYNYAEDGTTDIINAVGGKKSVCVNEQKQPVLMTDPDGGRTEMQYDTSTNLTALTNPLGHCTKLTYDKFGNVTKVINPLKQSARFDYDLRFNKLSSITDLLGNIISLKYDSRGNLKSQSFSDVREKFYEYDAHGNLVTEQDAAGKTNWYSYNKQGLMTSSKDALGHVIQFSYDAAGDLERLVDAKGHTISHTRDKLGRLRRRTYPDGSYEDYKYDAAGKVTAFTNRQGQKISFFYNVTGGLEYKVYPSGRKLHFHYDPRGLVSKVELASSETTLGAAYEYDLSGRLVSVKVSGKTAPESYEISYAYDAAGNRTFMAYPDGYVLKYEYDAVDRLKRVSEASGKTIVAYEYEAAGRRIKRTLGNGTYTTYKYDSLGQLIQLTNHAPDSKIQSHFQYSYNAAGMRTSMTTLEGVYSYAYDDTYQLTGAEYPEGTKFEYAFDEVGNRTSSTNRGVLTSYTTNDLNQYTRAGAEAFEYDTNGNLAARSINTDVTRYKWDEDGQLVSTLRNGVLIEYRYDHQGRLVAKKVGGLETRYIWDEMSIIAEIDSSGKVIKRYVYGDVINEIILVAANGANYLCQQDGLSSVVGVTDDTGNEVATCSYDVYGNVRNGDYCPVPQRFAGMWWDEDAGLYYVRARWYEPMMGRFILPDPINIRGGDNLYTYVDNNPTNYVDPFGLDTYYINNHFGKPSNTWSPVSHSFIATTYIDPVTGKETVTNTYSWTNKNGGSWEPNFPQDMLGAQAAIDTNVGAWKQGGEDLDAAVAHQFSQRENEVGGYNFFRNNCKHQARRLISNAKAEIAGGGVAYARPSSSCHQTHDQLIFIVSI